MYDLHWPTDMFTPFFPDLCKATKLLYLLDPKIKLHISRAPIKNYTSRHIIVKQYTIWFIQGKIHSMKDPCLSKFDR